MDVNDLKGLFAEVNKRMSTVLEHVWRSVESPVSASIYRWRLSATPPGVFRV